MSSTLILKTLVTIIAGVITAMIIYWLKKPSIKDKDRFDFYRFVFDRPAFRGVFIWHCNMEEYLESLSETMKALNTGYFKNYDLKPNPKRAVSKIHNKEWKLTMENITDSLQNIKQVLQNESLKQEEKAKAIDIFRDDSIKNLNVILEKLNITILRIPTEVKNYNEVMANK